MTLEYWVPEDEREELAREARESSGVHFPARLFIIPQGCTMGNFCNGILPRYGVRKKDVVCEECWTHCNLEAFMRVRSELFADRVPIELDGHMLVPAGFGSDAMRCVDDLEACRRREAHDRHCRRIARRSAR